MTATPALRRLLGETIRRARPLYAPEEVEQAVDAVSGVRAGCAVAVSWLPEEADGEVLLVLVEARREIPPEDYPAVAERSSQAVLAATGLLPERVVGPGPRDPAADLLGQAAPSRGPAPVPRRGARTAGPGQPPAAGRRHGALGRRVGALGLGEAGMMDSV